MFAPPPQANVQPFQITPVQNTNPLETLSQMQQMRGQSLQLQQQQLQFKSQQAMMQAFANGNGDWPTTQKLLDSSPDILPTDRMAVEQHRIQLMQSAAALDEAKQKILSTDTDRYLGHLQGVLDSGSPSQTAIDQANLDAEKENISSQVPRLMNYTNPTDLQGFINSHKLQTQIIEQAKTQAQTTEATAGAAKSTAEAGKADLEKRFLQAKIDAANNLFGTPAAPGPAQPGAQGTPGAGTPGTPVPGVPAQAPPAATVQGAAQGPSGLVRLVNTLLPPTDQFHADLNRRAIASATIAPHDIESLQKAIQPYVDAADQYEKERGLTIDPQVMQARAEQARMTAQATIQPEVQKAGQTAAITAPTEIRKGIATAVGTAQAKAALAPGVLAQIPESMQSGAIESIKKYSDAFVDKVGAQLKLRDTIQGALKGNQALSTMAVMDLARAALSRVTQNEISLVGGSEGVSMLRHAANFLSQKFTGTLSEDQLQEFLKLADLGVKAAVREQHGNALGFKQIYGQPGPELSPDDVSGPAPTAGAAAGKGRHTIRVGNDFYVYNGSGDTKDLKNYTKLNVQ